MKPTSLLSVARLVIFVVLFLTNVRGGTGMTMNPGSPA